MDNYASVLNCYLIPIEEGSYPNRSNDLFVQIKKLIYIILGKAIRLTNSNAPNISGMPNEITSGLFMELKTLLSNIISANNELRHAVIEFDKNLKYSSTCNQYDEINEILEIEVKSYLNKVKTSYKKIARVYEVNNLTHIAATEFQSELSEIKIFLLDSVLYYNSIYKDPRDRDSYKLKSYYANLYSISLEVLEYNSIIMDLLDKVIN